MHLQDIYIYPIKSLGGIKVEEAITEEKGLQYDRRWMLVDKNRVFITQRNIFRLALLQVRFIESGLEVFQKKNPEIRIEIPFLPQTDTFLNVTIWEDEVVGQLVDPAIGKWFSDQIGIPCDLVYMPEDSERKLKPKYSVNNESVSFSDGMPYLIIGQESLNDLNSKLENPVPMDRFRPNLVFSGAEHFEEDGWDTVQIGEAVFKVTKPCARCVLTTVNQDSGIRGKEPLLTLSQYRKVKNKIMFGQKMLLLKGDKIKVGDAVSGKMLQKPIEIKDFHVQ